MSVNRMVRILLAVVAMVVVGLAPTWLALPDDVKLKPNEHFTPWWLFAWLVNLALMLLIAREISYMCGHDAAGKVKGGAFAILVDGDNRFSLSRLQLVLWTLVVLSAFWTMAMTRTGDSLKHKAGYECAPVAQAQVVEGEEGEGEAEAEACPAAPLDIQIPVELWALMGISMTGAVAAPLVRETKKQRTLAQTPAYQNMLDEGHKQAVDLAAKAGKKGLEAPKQEFMAVGGVVVRLEEEDPKWSDLFMSMDVQKSPRIDMGKVQNFFFTAIAVVGYGVMLGAAFWANTRSFGAFFQMPVLSEGLLAILGISHAAKLVEQNLTTTPTPSPPPADPSPPTDPSPPAE